MKDITKAEWKKLVPNDENAIILDVRTDEEFEAGHMPGAVQMDIYQPAEFLAKIEKLDKSKDYYVYCRSGGRSAQACQIMDQMNFDGTFNLLGGFEEWDGEKTEQE